MTKNVFSQKKKKNLSSLFFFFFFLFLLSHFKSIKVLELQNYIHIAALLFNHVLTWSTLVEIFSFIEKKKKLYLYCSTKCCTWSTYYWSNILIHKNKKLLSFFPIFFFSFFFFLLSQSKSLNYKTLTLQLYCSTMCWRGLFLLKYSHS